MKCELCENDQAAIKLDLGAPIAPIELCEDCLWEEFEGDLGRIVKWDGWERPLLREYWRLFGKPKRTWEKMEVEE